MAETFLIHKTSSVRPKTNRTLIARSGINPVWKYPGSPWENEPDAVLSSTSYEMTPLVNLASVSYFEYKNSISTPDWYVKEKVHVDIKPSINLAQYLRRPKMPVLWFPKRKPLRPYKPKRLNQANSLKPPLLLFKGKKPTAQQLKNFELKQNLYEQKLRVLKTIYESRERSRREAYVLRVRKRDEMVRRYKALYERRMAKYRRRLAIYERRLEIVKSWKKRSRFSRRRAASSGLLPDNPYSHVKLRALAGGMRLVESEYSRNNDGWNPLGMSNVRRSHIWSRLTDVDPLVSGPNRTYWTTALLKERRALDEQTLAKLYKRISEQKVHVANFIAQRAQTVDLLVTSSRRLLELMRLKRRVLSSAGKYLLNPKKIGDDFLAFQFGWKPLLSDIFSASEALSNISDADKDTLIFSSGSRVPLNGNYLVGPELLKLEGLLQCRYTVRFGVANPAAQSLRSYGLINPLEIAWEVLPWSFVVDWFLPVGQYIQNLSATAGLEFLTATKSYKLTGIARSSSITPDSAVNWSENADAFFGSSLGFTSSTSTIVTGDYTYDVKLREVLTELPDAPFPEFKSPFSTIHSLEALALLVQKILR